MRIMPSKKSKAINLSDGQMLALRYFAGEEGIFKPNKNTRKRMRDLGLIEPLHKRKGWMGKDKFPQAHPNSHVYILSEEGHKLWEASGLDDG